MRLLIILIVMFASACAIHNREFIVYFKPCSVEVSQNIDAIAADMNPSEKYIIEGYSCDADKIPDIKERLAMGTRRANKLKDAFIEKGFPQKNLFIISYDHGLDCKAVIRKHDKNI